MGLFRNDPQTVRLESQDVELKASKAPWSLWADGFGKLGIRAIQIIVVVIVAAGVIIANQQLTVVTIPLVIALILACAFAPVMGWMRGRGIPSLLARLLLCSSREYAFIPFVAVMLLQCVFRKFR